MSDLFQVGVPCEFVTLVFETMREARRHSDQRDFAEAEMGGGTLDEAHSEILGDLADVALEIGSEIGRGVEDEGGVLVSDGPCRGVIAGLVGVELVEVVVVAGAEELVVGEAGDSAVEVGEAPSRASLAVACSTQRSARAQSWRSARLFTTRWEQRAR